MKRIAFVLSLLWPLSTQAADAIIHLDTPGQTLYARVMTSSTASVAVALTEGTSNAVGRYVITEASLVSGGLSSAGNYPFKVFSGSPSTSANDPMLGQGVLYWSGSVVLTLPYGTEVEVADADFRAALGMSAADLDSQLDAIVADTNELQTAWVNGGRLDLILDDILLDTGTTLQAEVDGIQADTEDIQSRLPAALVSGRMDASVGAMASGVVTASAVATGAVDADALATDAVSEIADGAWDEAISGHLTAGSTGAALNAAGSAGDPWTTTLPGSYTGSQAGKIIADILDDTGTSGVAIATGQTIEFSDTELRAAIGLAAANLDTQLDALPTAAENASDLLNTVLSDTGAGEAGRALYWLYNTFASNGVFDTASLANAPAGGGGSLTDVDQEPVPESRVFVLVRDDDGGLNAEDAKSLTVGEAPTFAVNFASDMATGERINTVSTPTIAVGTEGGITFANEGRDKSYAKFRATGVTAGDYTVHVEVEYRSGATAVGIVRFTVVD